MKRLAFIIALGLVLVACQEQHMQDIDTETRWGELSLEVREDQLTIQPFDQIDVFQNLNQYPNMIRVCMDGVAFLMVSANWYPEPSSGWQKPYERMPQWDSYCEAAAMRAGRREPEG